VRETALRLESEGFPAWLVGESLMRLLCGETPPAFELATTAPPERCLELFPRAVPTDPGRGVVTVPTGRTPVDLSSLRRGARVQDDLAHRDFTVLAVAFRPATEELVDPWSGVSDLDERRLRCVGSAGERLQEDPLRVLRAIRLVAEHAFAPDPELVTAMTERAGALAALPAARVRRELYRIVLGEHAAAALALLRQSGIERRLIRGVRGDAAALVASLPLELEIRLAGWLRGTRPRPLLRRLRFGLARSRRIEQLLAYHPLDEHLSPVRDRTLLRLLRQLEQPEISALFALRRFELEHAPAGLDVAAARKQIEAIREGLARVAQTRDRSRIREELALDGRAVMELLGCGPGRRVGAALRYAAELIAAEPAHNEPKRLREAVLAWDRRTHTEAGTPAGEVAGEAAGEVAGKTAEPSE
jgi:tRNA nucleotidyltransferase (CCA-adding enzyme)